MADQPRTVKVLSALLVSMTIGAIVLMALGNNPPSAGAFCLSSYYRLNSIEKTVLSEAPQSPSRWKAIEVYFSNTRAGNKKQLASLKGLASVKDLNCHFVVCNGLGGSDGQIEVTEKWQKQWSAIPSVTFFGSAQTIRICVISDQESLTDTQMKRTEALVELLYRKFQITPENIYYPDSWN